jgi:hypothetical protein
MIQTDFQSISNLKTQPDRSFYANEVIALAQSEIGSEEEDHGVSTLR